MGCITARTIASRTGDAVSIRSAQPEDAESLLAYIRAVAAETEFFVMEPNEFPSTDEQERQWIREHLDRPGWLALVAEAAGAINGNVSFENGSHRRIAHRGTIGISVTKDWRGKGIGTALLQTLIEWAEANPLIEKLSLAVFANNENAIGLYRKLGFVEEGRQPRDVKLGPGRYVDTILLYRLVKQPPLPAPLHCNAARLVARTYPQTKTPPPAKTVRWGRNREEAK
jgi:RimJ/RimL family protein N-acetyltransferase